METVYDTGGQKMSIGSPTRLEGMETIVGSWLGNFGIVSPTRLEGMETDHDSEVA